MNLSDSWYEFDILQPLDRTSHRYFKTIFSRRYFYCKKRV